MNFAAGQVVDICSAFLLTLAFYPKSRHLINAMNIICDALGYPYPQEAS